MKSANERDLASVRAEITKAMRTIHAGCVNVGIRVSKSSQQPCKFDVTVGQKKKRTCPLCFATLPIFVITFLVIGQLLL